MCDTRRLSCINPAPAIVGRVFPSFVASVHRGVVIAKKLRSVNLYSPGSYKLGHRHLSLLHARHPLAPNIRPLNPSHFSPPPHCPTDPLHDD
jgi:hypothetical protein